MSETCYRFRVYDMATDDYVYSTRYATMTQINRIRAEAIYPGEYVHGKYLNDGWTKKGFDPKNPDA
jgi:hypothetical protein